MLWNAIAVLETASCSSVTHDDLGSILCIMPKVGTIVARTFFAKLSPLSAVWLLQASGLHYALCLKSGLSLPALALLPGYHGLLAFIMESAKYRGEPLRDP